MFSASKTLIPEFENLVALTVDIADPAYYNGSWIVSRSSVEYDEVSRVEIGVLWLSLYPLYQLFEWATYPWRLEILWYWRLRTCTNLILFLWRVFVFVSSEPEVFRMEGVNGIQDLVDDL